MCGISALEINRYMEAPLQSHGPETRWFTLMRTRYSVAGTVSTILAKNAIVSKSPPPGRGQRQRVRYGGDTPVLDACGLTAAGGNGRDTLAKNWTAVTLLPQVCPCLVLKEIRAANRVEGIAAVKFRGDGDVTCEHGDTVDERGGHVYTWFTRGVPSHQGFKEVHHWDDEQGHFQAYPSSLTTCPTSSVRKCSSQLQFLE